MGNPAKRLTLKHLTRKHLALLLLPALLAACQTDDGTSMFPTADPVQSFPSDYRSQSVAFLHSYINNPVGVHNAEIAAPVQRTVGGRVRFVGCLRFSERQSDGSYHEPREHAVLFLNGRLDRMIQNASDECEGVAYEPFPELEKMTR